MLALLLGLALTAEQMQFSATLEPQDARAAAESIWDGGDTTFPKPVSVRDSQKKQLPEYSPPRVHEGRPGGEPVPSIAEERAALQRKRAPANFLRKIAQGTAGVIVGLATGWAVGAGAAVYAVHKAPNPKLKTWHRWALTVPAAVAGLVVGTIGFPILLGTFFYQAESYPGKNVPDMAEIRR